MQAICHSICGFTDAFLEIRHFSNYSFLAIIFNYMCFYCTYVSHILHNLLCFIYSNLTLLVQASPCSCHHVGIAGEIPCSLEKHQVFKNHSRDSGMLRAPKCHQSTISTACIVWMQKHGCRGDNQTSKACGVLLSPHVA